jgi:G3E family GTPase
VSDEASKLLLLPMTVTGHAHLAKLVRELETVENDLESQKAHSRDQTPTIPPMSQALADVIELNKVDITKTQQRMQLKSRLGYTKDRAPTMHFTFAVQADPESLQQLAEYVRREIHPQALISVGLQPELVGGVYLRTPNHVHDFSLKQRLHDQRGLISQALEQLRSRAGAVQAPPAPVSAPAQQVPAAVQPAAPTGRVVTRRAAV